MLKKTLPVLNVTPVQFKLGDHDLTEVLNGYILEATTEGVRLHMIADVDLGTLDVPVDQTYQAEPPPAFAEVLAMTAEDWDAVVMQRPSFGEGSNPGAKIHAAIQQMAGKATSEEDGGHDSGPVG